MLFAASWVRSLVLQMGSPDQEHQLRLEVVRGVESVGYPGAEDSAGAPKPEF